MVTIPALFLGSSNPIVIHKYYIPLKPELLRIGSRKLCWNMKRFEEG